MISESEIRELYVLVEPLDFFLEKTLILGQKLKNMKLNLNKDLFFRVHLDFETKSEVHCLLGPPIFLISQNSPQIKKRLDIPVIEGYYTVSSAD